MHELAKRVMYRIEQLTALLLILIVLLTVVTIWATARASSRTECLRRASFDDTSSSTDCGGPTFAERSLRALIGPAGT